MAELRIQSKIEQVASYLRGELESRRWEGLMPGRLELASEFGLNPRTVEEALQILEKEGILIPQGAGRRRRIALESWQGRKVLKIGILMYDRDDYGIAHEVDLRNRLDEAGHRFEIGPHTISELGMDMKRVARMVKKMHADAWVVTGGSYSVLKWFAEQEVPVIAKFGRFTSLPIAGAGVRKIPAMREVVRRLHELGHRRIVMVAREERRKPNPGAFEQAFLAELEQLGIRTGGYHLPDWENNTADFHRCIDSLFRHTPPTALLLSEARLYVAAQQHLAALGLIAPRDISLVCDDPDTAFSWCDPPISHIRWDSRPVVSRIMRWVDSVARGREDKKHWFTTAEFVEGGTIGPVPGR